jgi:hypothetical protein
MTEVGQEVTVTEEKIKVVDMQKDMMLEAMRVAEEAMKRHEMER